MHAFGLHFRSVAIRAGLHDHETDGDLTLQIIGDADDGAFGHVRVGGQNLFHGPGGEAVAGDVDDVVGARHDVEIAVLVDVSGVGGFVIAGKARQIAFDEALIVAPQRWQAGGRQRQFHADGAQFSGGQLFAVFVQHVDFVTGHGHAGRAVFRWQKAQPHGIGGDGPSGFGLPPVVDHRHAQMALGPVQGVGIGALAGQEEGPEAGQIVIPDEFALRVFLLDGAEGRGGGEQHLDLVLLDDAPEDAGVRGAHRLALEDDGRAAVQQRAIDDVAVAHHPADIGCGPVDIAGLDIIDVLHAPFQRHHVAAVVAHHALGLAGGAGGIEDIERIGRRERRATGAAVLRLGQVHQLRPVMIAVGDHAGALLGALQDDAGVRLVAGELDGLVEQRLVGDDAARLDAAGGGENEFRFGVLDAGGQFIGGEPAEDHRMHRANARAGQHGDDGFGHHGHVDDDPVALLHGEIAQDGGKTRDFVEQLRVGDGAFRAGDGGIVDDGGLISAPGLHMAVHAVVAGVALRSGEPAAIDAHVRIENLVPGFDPVNLLRRFAPESLWIGLPAFIDLVIAAHVFPSFWS